MVFSRWSIVTEFKGGKKGKLDTTFAIGVPCAHTRLIIQVHPHLVASWQERTKEIITGQWVGNFYYQDRSVSPRIPHERESTYLVRDYSEKDFGHLANVKQLAVDKRTREEKRYYLPQSNTLWSPSWDRMCELCYRWVWGSSEVDDPVLTAMIANWSRYFQVVGEILIYLSVVAITYEKKLEYDSFENQY